MSIDKKNIYREYIYYGRQEIGNESHKNPSPKITCCLLLGSNGKFARGIAVCGYNDQPNKKVGKQLARQRAYKALMTETSSDEMETFTRLFAEEILEFPISKYKSFYIGDGKTIDEFLPVERKIIEKLLKRSIAQTDGSGYSISQKDIDDAIAAFGKENITKIPYSKCHERKMKTGLIGNSLNTNAIRCAINSRMHARNDLVNHQAISGL